MIEGFGDMGASVSLAAVGSALGTGTAGMAVVGAWKKCYAQNRKAPLYPVRLCRGAAVPDPLRADTAQCHPGGRHPPRSVHVAVNLRASGRSGHGFFLLDAGKGRGGSR